MAYKACKHVNPVAGVYKLENIINGMVYIGESTDLIHRHSSYRTIAHRHQNRKLTPLEAEIQKEGLEAFTFDVLESSNEDVKLKDDVYRRERETYYIELYDSTNPEKGYNRRLVNNIGLRTGGKRNDGFKHTTRSKLMGSKPVLAYNIEDGSVMLYMSGTSYCTIKGYKDESMVSLSIHKGQPLHGELMYRLDFGERIKWANAVIRRIMKDIERDNSRTTHYGKGKERLERYLKGLQAVNEWCEEFHCECVNIDELLQENGYTTD